MSDYIVSARKYRPAVFGDVVGQEALTRTLRNAIQSGKLAHSYLFCGPRGVGKTTCARIFAKTINCGRKTPEGEACGECESCRAFDEGRSLNIREIDAASNNGVDEMHDIIEQVSIPPQIGRYKVFIIDEVHMLSRAAFNAFLKTLEEPPGYVVFILATTEKQKIIPTILSRCQIYDFKRIETDDIIGQLKKIAGREGIAFEEEALRVVAEKSDGGMRDALSIFDQQTIFTGGDLTYRKVISNLNILDYDYMFAITDLLLRNDIPKTLLIFDEITGNGFDGGIFIDGLAGHLRDLMVSSDAATVALLRKSRKVGERYKEQASRCSKEFLFKALKLCRDCGLNYRASGNKRLLVELTLIEIAQAAAECGRGAGEDPLAPEGGGSPTGTLKPIFKDTQKAEERVQPGANSQQAGGTGSEGNAALRDSPAAGQPGRGAAGDPASDAAGQPRKAERKPNVAKVISIRGFQMQGRKDKTDTDSSSGGADGPSDGGLGAEPYDERLFSVAWLQFAESLPPEESDIAGRMKATSPELQDGGLVNVRVENQAVEKFMQPTLPRLEKFLREKLNNRGIKVRLCVASEEERPPVNAVEQFRKMMSGNPCLSRMNSVFQLEII